MVGRPVAKEVGMGNPAEKNDRTPNHAQDTEPEAGLSRTFYKNFTLLG
jgi:hypothetical protein